MRRLLPIALAPLALVGCGSPEAVKETSPVEARQKLDGSLSKSQQDELGEKLKAWDPKKDKK